MDKKHLHDLAITYAQARLTRKQYDSEKPPTHDELYNFVYDYHFALDHVEKIMKHYHKA